MKTTRLILCVLLSMPVCNLVYAEALLPVIQKSKSPEEAMSILRTKTGDEIMEFCNEYGKLIDSKQEPAESAMIPFSLVILQEKGSLTQDKLLEVVNDKSASENWRAICIKYCSRDKFIDPTAIDVESGFQNLMHVIQDTSESISIRETAILALGVLLYDGYYWIYCQSSEMKLVRDKNLIEAISADRSPEILQHDARVATYANECIGKMTGQLNRRAMFSYQNIAEIRRANTPMISLALDNLDERIKMETDGGTLKHLERMRKDLSKFIQP